MTGAKKIPRPAEAIKTRRNTLKKQAIIKGYHGEINGAQGRGSMPYHGAISNLTFNYINSLAYQH